MGTRSLTIVRNQKNDNNLVILYSQYDGDYFHYGLQLATFLNKVKLVNGLPLNSEYLITSNGVINNGMECLAASIIAHFKKAPGYYYLKSGASNFGQEYIYYVYQEDDIIKIQVEKEKFGNILFYGTPQEYINWIENERN